MMFSSRGYLTLRSLQFVSRRHFLGGAQGQRNHSILLSASEASKHIGDPNVKFIDVRDPTEYTKAHVPGAVNMREFFTFLGMSSPKGKEDMVNTFTELLQSKGVDGTEKLITYEGNFRGTYGASCRAWYMLDLLGHTNTSVLHGGWDAWMAEGYPSESGEEAVSDRRGSFTSNWNNSKWVGLDDIYELLACRVQGNQERETKLLDVRDFVEWNAHSSSPYGVNFTPKMGRLPDAVHVEWYNLMETRPDGVTFFKSPDEIRTIMQEKGIEPHDDIVVYCFKGARAANSLIALDTAGFKNVRNYFASWNELSRQDNPDIDEKKY